MKILKRLLVIIGFVPAILIGGINWILTGTDEMIFVNKLIAWGTKSKTK